MTILNLTQHQAIPEQIAAGVVNVVEEERAELSSLLTFDEIPSQIDMVVRARALVKLALTYSAKSVMIGGAPFFMSTLEKELVKEEIQPLYAFSRRESVDEVQPDGKVIKRAVFRHLGFVEAAIWRRENA